MYCSSGMRTGAIKTRKFEMGNNFHFLQVMRYRNTVQEKRKDVILHCQSDFIRATNECMILIDFCLEHETSNMKLLFNNVGFILKSKQKEF